MGCVESSEALSTEDEEEAPPVAKQTVPVVEKGKKRKKSSARSKGGKKSVDIPNLREQSENTKIHVIWRRCSVFSNRRDSGKSEKSQEGEGAGPSQKPSEELQVKPSHH